LLLSGVDIDALGFRELVAVAEAAMIEPAIHGSVTSVDEMLTKVEQAIAETYEEGSTWGETTAAQAGHAAMEALWPMAEPRPEAPPDEPEQPTIPA
jgi:hypothetical protein